MGDFNNWNEGGDAHVPRCLRYMGGRTRHASQCFGKGDATTGKMMRYCSNFFELINQGMGFHQMLSNHVHLIVHTKNKCCRNCPSIVPSGNGPIFADDGGSLFPVRPGERPGTSLSVPCQMSGAKHRFAGSPPSPEPSSILIF